MKINYINVFLNVNYYTFGINSNLFFGYPRRTAARLLNLNRSSSFLRTCLATTTKIVIASGPVTYARDRFLRNQRNSK